MPTALRLATRGSPQALAQSGTIAEALIATGNDVEIVTVVTTGDQQSDIALHTIGGQGVFVTEVQRAVLDGRADLAVHSAKDLPSTITDGLQIAAFGQRRNPNDALVGRSLAQLVHGASVATGSVRRRAQLADARPDIEFSELRGNIARRLERIPDGGAIVMAVAALQILGLVDRIAEELDPERFIPAVGQGAVAVECRVDDPVTAEILAGVDHGETRAAIEVERAFLAELGSGCSLPVGAHVSGGTLYGFLADTERSIVARDRRLLSGVQTADLDQAGEMARGLQAEVTQVGDGRDR
jgi:hydroxymethylbilane synthase